MEVSISHSVIGEEAKKQLGKLLAYENANQKCQRAITPIHETGAIIDYLKACRNLGSETQKMQMLVETIAAAFKKGNERCFACGDKTHWVRECRSKYDVEGKPISGNSKLGTPQVPIHKNQGQTSSFPSNPQHPAVLPVIYLNDFLLFPQAVPFRIPARLLEHYPHKPSVFYLANLV